MQHFTTFEYSFDLPQVKRDVIFDASRDLVPFVQLKKREKHRWRTVDFNKVAG